MRYFITFVTYGTHLHGHEGSVDRNHNLPGSRTLELDEDWVERERELMDQEPFLMDERDRAAVLNAIREVCIHQEWLLPAAHVRINHVHIVVEAEVRPEAIMSDFKRYASRSLNRAQYRKRWAHHGSTRWLWTDQEVRNAVRYVVEEQGAPMAVFCAEGI